MSGSQFLAWFGTGLVVGAAGALGAAAGLAAGALLSGPKRVSALDRGFMAAMGALLSMHGAQ